MSKYQLCMSRGGTHPGEGRFGVNLCTFFFFKQQRGFLVRLLFSFFSNGLSFKRRIRPLWWGEVEVEDIFGKEGYFNNTVVELSLDTVFHRHLTKYLRAKS